MEDYFGLTPKDMESLAKYGINSVDLFGMVEDFGAQNAKVSTISLYFYADKYGDFTEGDSKSDRVAQVLFEKQSVIDKIKIFEYIEFLEE